MTAEQTDIKRREAVESHFLQLLGRYVYFEVDASGLKVLNLPLAMEDLKGYCIFHTEC